MGFMAREVRLSYYQAASPHLKCLKSHKGLLTNFKQFIVNCAGRQSDCSLPFSNCVICKPYLVDSIVSSLI